MYKTRIGFEPIHSKEVSRITSSLCPAYPTRTLVAPGGSTVRMIVVWFAATGVGFAPLDSRVVTISATVSAVGFRTFVTTTFFPAGTDAQKKPEPVVEPLSSSRGAVPVDHPYGPNGRTPRGTY